MRTGLKINRYIAMPMHLNLRKCIYGHYKKRKKKEDTYLGSTTATNEDNEKDIDIKISKVNQASAPLQKTWKTKHIKLKNKV